MLAKWNPQRNFSTCQRGQIQRMVHTIKLLCLSASGKAWKCWVEQIILKNLKNKRWCPPIKCPKVQLAHRCMDIYTSPKTPVCHLGQVWAAVYQGAIKVLICLSKRISMFVKWSKAHRCTRPANKKEKEEIYKKLLVQCRHISYCWDQVFKKLWACPSVCGIVESSVYGFTTKIGGCSSSVNRRWPVSSHLIVNIHVFLFCCKEYRNRFQLHSVLLKKCHSPELIPIPINDQELRTDRAS